MGIFSLRLFCTSLSSFMFSSSFLGQFTLFKSKPIESVMRVCVRMFYVQKIHNEVRIKFCAVASSLICMYAEKCHLVWFHRWWWWRCRWQWCVWARSEVNDVFQRTWPRFTVKRKNEIKFVIIIIATKNVCNKSLRRAFTFHVRFAFLAAETSKWKLWVGSERDKL